MDNKSIKQIAELKRKKDQLVSETKTLNKQLGQLKQDVMGFMQKNKLDVIQSATNDGLFTIDIHLQTRSRLPAINTELVTKAVRKWKHEEQPLESFAEFFNEFRASQKEMVQSVSVRKPRKATVSSVVAHAISNPPPVLGAEFAPMLAGSVPNGSGGYLPLV